MTRLSVTFPEKRLTWNQGYAYSNHLDGLPYNDQWGLPRSSLETQQYADTLAWLGENGWSCAMYSTISTISNDTDYLAWYNTYGVNVSGYPNLYSLANNTSDYRSGVTPALECCLDAGVPVWLIIEVDMKSVDHIITTTSPPSVDPTQEAAFKDMITAGLTTIEDNSLYDAIVGYCWEIGGWIGTQWIYDVLHNDLGSSRMLGQQQMAPIITMTGTESYTLPYFWSPETQNNGSYITHFTDPSGMGYRLNYLDYWIWDVFSLDQVSNLNYAPGAMNYIAEYFSTKLGVQACQYGDPSVDYWCDNWTDAQSRPQPPAGRGMAGGYRTTAENIQRATDCLETLRYQLRTRKPSGLDIINAGVAHPPPFAGETMSYIEQCQFLDGLMLQTSNLRVQETSMDGPIPDYKGTIPYFTTPRTLTNDAFENTGAEIIMLRSSTGCKVHNISVVGSVTETYTIAIPPDQCAFFGPYPLAEFGSPLTIHYDNANLFISILKDTAYSA